MKKKEYKQQNNKKLKYDYNLDYDDNIEDTWPKKNMKPKKSIHLTRDDKMWKSLQNTLVEKGSTPITGYPLKISQLRNIKRELLEEYISLFFEKLAIIFNEEYIVFKQDGYGWLRKINALVPFYKNQEDIIFHPVLDDCYGNEIKKFSKGKWRYISIPKKDVRLYADKKIDITNKDKCRVIPNEIIESYYSNHEISLSDRNTKLVNSKIIGPLYSSGFSCFEYVGEMMGDGNLYYQIFPKEAYEYSSPNGFNVVFTKYVSVSTPESVLGYALQEFKQPNHPCLNNLDKTLYTILETMYKKDTFNENEKITICSLATIKKREKDRYGVYIYTAEEKEIRDKLFKKIVHEVESLNKYEDIIKYFGGDLEVQNSFYYKSIQSFLEVETARANIQPYELDVLRDLNKGHWDVYEILQRPMEADDVLIPVPNDQTLVARDPLADVNTKATCAIDFGTKSTVVVYHDGKSSLLRIGASDQWAEPRMEDYENPTALHIIDYNQFMEDYRSKEGRPATRWEDMTVSHHAAEKIYQKDISTDVYYSVFNELKQWANAVGRRQLLQDSKGRKIELKPYTSLKAGDFDPIEIYAYYLGLYINNMQRGICLKYYLSFPVNYALDIRNRILESFERGLRKSLPERVLNHENTMKRFKVKAGASEPAAYALSALKAYGVEPDEKEKAEAYTYGVFDFGGGTTDFDFGSEYIPDSNDYFYEIKQFNNGGDPLLGGENIINILAYEVFKENQQIMRDNKITIVIPNDKCKRFDGSQMLVKDMDDGDQVSYLNLKLLASFLRPIWEEKGDLRNDFGSSNVVIDLYNTSEEKKPVSIKVNVPMLQGVITEHIKDGIDNFMGTFKRAFKANESEWTWPLHILLAGNSCKARLLQEQLIIRLLQELEDMSRHLQKDVSDIFRLYPPLGVSFNVDALVKSITASGVEITDEQRKILDTMLYKEQ